MNIIRRGKLKRIDFTLAVGDLFDADVDAIVSSEPTDFVLAGNLDSISGQIWHRYGDSVQQELDQATKGEVLHAGTVIETSGGRDFARIFHAGFHDPDDWPDARGDSQDTTYFDAIGSCIRQVLEAARTQKLSSVAFPLIGCGRFGLDERMLILQFMDAVETLDDRLTHDEKLTVWLVIRDRAQFEAAVGVFLDLLLRARSEMVVVQIEQSGFPILDRFAKCLAKRSNEDWAKWQLCRLTEIALEIMCYGLSRGIRPLPTPESLFEQGKTPTFGVVRELALKLAAGVPANMNVWGAKFFADILNNEAAACALETLNTQRNNLAHGRTTLPLADIRKLVVQGLHLGGWERISDADGELRLSDWTPWIVTSSATNGQTGLFERWQKNEIRYLVPETGEVFKAPRKSAEPQND
jgi:O-acetyl-ADP-ribose deacetylase (regulator of RNase III)